MSVQIKGKTIVKLPASNYSFKEIQMYVICG